jgi:hypothetical protein
MNGDLTARVNYHLGPEWNKLVREMAWKEDRPQSAVVRRALELYAQKEHPTLIFTTTNQKEKR